MEIKTADFVTSMAQYGAFAGRGPPQIAVAGKSNVRKSSLINCLCRSDKLARTQQPSCLGKSFLCRLTFQIFNLTNFCFHSDAFFHFFHATTTRSMPP